MIVDYMHLHVYSHLDGVVSYCQPQSVLLLTIMIPTIQSSPLK